MEVADPPTPEVRTMCIKPDQNCQCFEGNIRAIAERRGRTRKGFPSARRPS